MIPRRLLFGLFLLFLGSFANSQSVQLDMSIEEFLEIYPELSPTSLRFTGRIEGDTLWGGLQWHQSFSFGMGAMTAALWQSEAYTSPEDCELLETSFRQITQLLDTDYESHNPDLEESWRFYKSPDSLLNAKAGTVPYRVWHSGRTLIVLRYEVRHVRDSSGLDVKPALGLRLEMAANPKNQERMILPQAPMVASMPIENFGALYPHLVGQGLGFQGVRSREEQIGAVRGTWTYWFDQGKLQHYEWYRGIPDLPASNEALFSTIQETIQQLIQALEVAIGSYEDIEDLEGDSKVYEGARWELKEEVVEVKLADFQRGVGYGYFVRWKVSKNTSPPD